MDNYGDAVNSCLGMIPAPSLPLLLWRNQSQRLRLLIIKSSDMMIKHGFPEKQGGRILNNGSNRIVQQRLSDYLSIRA